MYYNQSCGQGRTAAPMSEAAKGTGNRARHLQFRSAQRAPVNIYKTENSFELLVFAPGRLKEHFSIDVEGRELRVSYTPPEGFPRPDWVQREYSRGGFLRSFTLDERFDTGAISAKYTDGVLQVTLPLLPDAQPQKKQVVVS